MIKREVIKGFLMGLCATIFGVALCTLLIATSKSAGFSETFYGFEKAGNLWMLLALGAIPNLIVFFLLLRKDLEYKARGVVLATLLVAFIAYTIYFI